MTINKEDADPTTDSHQINLADSDNTITIIVTAENNAVNVARIFGGRTLYRKFDLTVGNNDSESLPPNPRPLVGRGRNVGYGLY